MTNLAIRQDRNQDAATVGERETGVGILADLPAPVRFTMPTPPSANHLFKNVKGVGRVQTSHYSDFIRMGIAAIRRQSVQPIIGRVIVLASVERMSDKADIDNRMKALLDAIVKAGIIEDDRFVTWLPINWLPAANGLSHIAIYPVQRMTLEFYPSQDGASGAVIVTAPQFPGEDDGYQPE
jgi:Holliday junction resolvase RusA-like endonuclease